MPLAGGFSTGISRQTQLTFDNARVSLTASQSDETIPATGESDSGMFSAESSIDTADVFEVSANSGTNFAEALDCQGTRGFLDGITGENIQLANIGNSTARYRVVVTATVGTRIYSQIITTVAEE